jgi:hypothetical protein
MLVKLRSEKTSREENARERESNKWEEKQKHGKEIKSVT